MDVQCRPEGGWCWVAFEMLLGTVALLQSRFFTDSFLLKKDLERRFGFSLTDGKDEEDPVSSFSSWPVETQTSDAPSPTVMSLKAATSGEVVSRALSKLKLLALRSEVTEVTSRRLMSLSTLSLLPEGRKVEARFPGGTGDGERVQRRDQVLLSR